MLKTTSGKRPAAMFRALGIGLAACALLQGCNPNKNKRVEITYRQLAYFPEYKTSEDSFGSHGAGKDGMFILYRIDRIANTGSEAAAFGFDKANLSTVQDHLVQDMVTDQNILLGPKLMGNVTVAANSVKTDGLGCLIMRAKMDDVAKSFGGVSGTGKKIDLMHVLAVGDQPVSIGRAAGNDNFTGIAPAHPQDLQNKCG